MRSITSRSDRSDSTDRYNGPYRLGARIRTISSCRLVSTFDLHDLCHYHGKKASLEDADNGHTYACMATSKGPWVTFQILRNSMKGHYRA